MFDDLIFTIRRISTGQKIVFALLGLNLFSLAALYSSLHQAGEFAMPNLFYKQIAWIIVSWAVLFFTSRMNYRFLYFLGYILYGLGLVLLVIVEVAGRTSLGAKRWLDIGGLNFQPSELVKIAIIALLAKFFAESRERGVARGFFFPLMLVLFAAGLIFKQPDLGTGLVILMLFWIMGFSSGVRRWLFVLFLALGVGACPVVWKHLKDYQRKRIVVFINPNVDPLGAGYTIIQSKIAIGSGQLAGKGFLSGTQNQFNFLPERHTDFIFTVIAEEWGFLGSLFLLILYWIILDAVLAQSRRLEDLYAKMLCVGIATLFFLHVFINIGMTLGILPVVGIPLLLLSYGGTHVLANFFLMGVFFNIMGTDR